jgi:hypothetical protein
LGQDGAVAEGLLDRRGHVGVVAGVDLRHQALEDGRLADQPLEGPGQGGGGRLVARHQQGQQLIVDLFVAHRRAVLVGRFQQHREDVVAIGSRGAPLVDQGEEALVDFRLHPHELGEWTDAFGHFRHHRVGLGRHQADRAVAELEHRRQPFPQRIEARAGVETEDGAEDDLQGQVLHPRVQGERYVARERRHLLGSHFLHQPGQALHPLAVEGGEHQLALLHVLTFVEQDHRVAADDRFQHLRPPAGVEDVGRRGEDLFHLVGVGDVHERRRERQSDREALPVALAAAVHEGQGSGPKADHLQRRRQRRTGG